MRLFIVLAVIMASFGVQAEAQTRAGSGPRNTSSSEMVDNACRERVNDLRIGIGSLRNDINLIRQCSQNGQLAMRISGNIVCRDVTQGHHVWDVTKTDIRFATDPNTLGGNKSLLGPQGDPGRDVRCENCTESWEPPVCESGWTVQHCSTGNNADCVACWGPSTHISEVCGSFGPTCALPAVADVGNWSSCSASCETTCTSQECRRLVGGQPTGDVVACGYCGLSPSTATTCSVPAAQSCSGGSCSACDDWTPVNTWCDALDRNVVSSHSCPSGNCCDPEPATETCPDSCSPGFYTYDYTSPWRTCADGVQTRDCERCDGAIVDCSYCGGECSRTCTPQCTTYTWVPSSGWGNCSGGGTTQNCGTGTQTRPGECRCDQSGETVDDSMCNLADRQRNCSGWTYSYGDWGSCSGASKSRDCERCDGTAVACSNCGGVCSSNEGCGGPIGMSCVCASPSEPPAHLRFRCATPADFAFDGMNCLYNHYATPAPQACGNTHCAYGCWDFRSMMPLDHCPYPPIND